jgi:hypothetical protein
VAVAVAEDGRLVLLDPVTGTEIREAAYHGPPVGDGEPLTTYITSASLAADGQVIYYTTCCEPSPGAVHSMPTSGGAGGYVADGAPVAVGPNGTIAIADVNVGIKLMRPPAAVGELLQLDRSIPLAPQDVDGDDSFDPEVVGDVAWDGEGRHLLAGLGGGSSGGRIGLISLAGDEPNVEVLAPNQGVSWGTPRFGPMGSIYVIEERDGQPATLRQLDRTGSDRGVVDLGGRAPLALAADDSTGWLLVSLADGGLTTIGPSGDTSAPVGEGRYVSLDW